VATSVWGEHLFRLFYGRRTEHQPMPTNHLPTVNPDQAYDELVRRSRDDTLLSSCLELLEWDEEVCMPRGGVKHRAAVGRRIGSPPIGRALFTILPKRGFPQSGSGAARLFGIVRARLAF